MATAMDERPLERARPVSRAEVAGYIRPAFDDGPASVEELRATALEQGARAEVIAVLDELRDTRRRFMELRNVWIELPDLPVEA